MDAWCEPWLACLDDGESGVEERREDEFSVGLAQGSGDVFAAVKASQESCVTPSLGVTGGPEREATG